MSTSLDSSKVAAAKKAILDYSNHSTTVDDYKPSEFVSPGAPSSSGVGSPPSSNYSGRKKVVTTKEKQNKTSERFGSCDDWLSPGQQRPGGFRKAKRSWQPKNPSLKNMSLYDM